jgi:hypothetical protein
VHHLCTSKTKAARTSQVEVLHKSVCFATFGAVKGWPRQRLP